MDSLLPRSGVPIFGRFSSKIRVFFARRISPNISKKAFIEKGAKIVPNVIVEDHGCVGINCLLSEYVYIGENSMMGPNCCFYTTSHKRTADGKSFKGNTNPNPIHILKNCWIGSNCIIMGGSYYRRGSHYRRRVCCDKKHSFVFACCWESYRC